MKRSRLKTAVFRDDELRKVGEAPKHCAEFMVPINVQRGSRWKFIGWHCAFCGTNRKLAEMN